ncbi:hypothetical protein ACO2Q8_28730 [Larkinella sp. VNQ87]|uniref:hypothetical protein n=1 Tax=Larkinella sp. VNQ87 TaxID=3400921 RepID=UPI003C07C42D
MRACLLLYFLISAPAAFSQTTRLEDLCQVFHLPDGKDTTTFIIFGSKTDLNIKKPLFLFRQGSLPMPFIHFVDGKYYLTAPFHFRDYRDEYHFVVIQKPGVRLVADSTFLNAYPQAIQQPNPPEEFVSKTYLANNHLDRYTAQCRQVLDYLVKQPWIDSQKVVFCGGSEGFTVGANLLANYPAPVTHAILFSGRTGRRFEHLIWQTRQQIDQGLLTSEEGQREIDKWYAVWEDICNHPTAIDKKIGDTYYAWHSFSRNNLANLLKIRIPLYIAYGTADEEMARELDMLPLEFIAQGKKNLTLKPYHQHDHQFFELKKDDKGSVVDKIYRGDEVTKDWMEWLRR